MLEIGVYGENGGAEVGNLILASTEALLLYHAASRDAALAQGRMIPNRLASIGREDEDPDARLAILLEPGTRDPAAGRLSLSELEAEQGAGLLALAEVLGAWGPLRQNRFPLAGDGRPVLPFFVPEEPEHAWDQLRSNPLEMFLPSDIADHVAGEPGYRERIYEDLFELSARLPELRASIASLARSRALRPFGPDVSQLEEILEANFAALRGYLDSVWVEQLVTLTSPTQAALALYLHSVVPVRLNGFHAALARRHVVLNTDAFAAMRLVDTSTGDTHAARLLMDGVDFPVGRTVDPVPGGPFGFRSVRLDFRVEGAHPALLSRVVERLEPRLTHAVSGEPVPRDHLVSSFSIRDPRYGLVPEETLDEFLAALSRRIRRVDGVQDAIVADRGARTIALAAEVYVVSDDLILPNGFGLTLQAGVELRIAPRKSVLVRGPLLVRGRSERPVRVRGLSQAEPWGVLAAQGKGAGVFAAAPQSLRSEIRHLELEGGSEDQLRGAHYRGQLSVYNQDLVLEHSVLHRSHADDSLNVTYGQVTVSDSRFTENRADAIDLDWCEGTVRRSFFSGAGSEGDGLDVSGSRVTVRDSVFSQIADKCLSVGENSRMDIGGSLLRDCSVAVASKDLSRTQIRESLLLDNERDFAAYEKKEIFGGGRIRGEQLIVANTRRGAERDRQSEIAISRSVLIDAEAGDMELSESIALSSDAAASALDSEALRTTHTFSRQRFRSIRAGLP